MKLLGDIRNIRTEEKGISFLNFIFPMSDKKRIYKIVFAFHEYSWTLLNDIDLFDTSSRASDILRHQTTPRF
jgi:hypothetical protein